MASPVLFKSNKFKQKDALFQFLVDDAWRSYMILGHKISEKITKRVEIGYRRAAQYLANRVKANIHSSNAVATGFMRNSVVVKIEVSSFFPKIKAKIIVGTNAWYDILVHEGLGRHSPSGKIPAKYRPTPEQLAIVPTSVDSAPFWKPSPKKPRPFMKIALMQSKNKMKKIVFEEIKDAYRNIGGRPGNPKHDITTILNSAPIR